MFIFSQTTWTGCNISFVAVFSESAAFNNSATQISLASSTLGAALAVNGIPGGQCSTTSKGGNPWWQVDLRKYAYVLEVYIVSGAPSEEFEVQVGEKGMSSHI